MRPLILLSLLILGGFNCSKNPEQLDPPKIPETLWKIPLSSGEETGTFDPVLYKNLVIYSANDNGDIRKSKLIALDKETGKQVWEWKNTNQLSGHIWGCETYLSNNILVLPILGKPYQIVAINLDNGTQIWHHTSPEAVNWQLVGSGNNVFHIRSNLDRMKDEIWVADVNIGHWQSVYAASNVNAPIFIQGMHAYKGNDGKDYLSFLVGKYNDFQFSEAESTIFKYRIDSNKMVYTQKLDFLPKHHQPFLKGAALNKLWLRDDPVIALNESTGTKQSEFFVPITASTTSGYIAIADTKLLMTTVEKLVCLDAQTGKFLWQEEGKTSGSPSRVLHYNNVIYYTSMGDGKFHAINATTGKSIYDVKSPDKKADGRGGFDTAITLDTVNKRIYTASYLSAICYKMPN
jgi:outer membrane protein assembly factor BamB